MKTIKAKIAGAKVNYSVPESIAELSQKAGGDDKVLNAANGKFIVSNGRTIVGKVVEALETEYKDSPRIYAGSKIVTEVFGEDKKLTHYLTDDGKKMKPDTKVKHEKLTAFIARVREENKISDEDYTALVQSLADATPFDATVKRGSGGAVRVSKKWLELAEKIVEAGNAESSAARLTSELGRTVAAEKTSLALALQDREKKRRDEANAELAALTGGVSENEDGEEDGEDGEEE